jgi:hypothetical protein
MTRPMRLHEAAAIAAASSGSPPRAGPASEITRLAPKAKPASSTATLGKSRRNAETMAGEQGGLPMVFLISNAYFATSM